MGASLADDAIHLTEITLLHVDDDPEFAELAGTFLERQDDRLAVETATSADAGLERLADGDVDCIVSDYDMPDVDGIEFLKAVRADHPDLPFILYTGKGSETVASEAFSAGATDYLQKERGTDQYTLLANKVTNYVEKYRTEREMRRRAQAMEAAGEGIALLDADGQYVSVNEAYADICRSTPETMVGTHWADSMPEDEAERLRTEAFTAVVERDSWTGEVTGRRDDGETYSKRLSLAALDDGGHVCIVRDVTERRTNQRELDRAQRKLRKLFTHANDAIFIVDPAGDEFVDCNRAAADLLGTSRERVLADLSPSSTHPDEVVDALRTFFDRVIEQGHGWTDEAPVVTVDGEVRPTEMSAAYIELDDRPCLVNIVRDVTDRERRKRERRRYEHMVNSMREAVCIYDAEGRFETVNESLAEFYDTTPGDLEGQQSRLVRRLRRDADGDPFRALLDGDRAELRGELGDEFPGHGYALLDYRLTPLSVDGTTDGVVGVARPIADRKECESQLRRYERIVEASGDPVYTLDADGRFTFVNDRLVERLGYDRDDLLGEHVSLLMDDDDVATGRRLIRSLLAGDDDRDRDTFEMDVRTADDEVVTCENHVALVTGDDGFEGTVGIVRDITDRKRREEELERKNDRLERFASLVSHDLRNPLNVAQGHLELARDGDGDGDGAAHLDDAANALDRCQRLVGDLLLLAREGDWADDPSLVSLGAVVETCWRHVETGDATLVVEADSTVVANRSRLQQLLENLIRNSVEHASTSSRTSSDDAVEQRSTGSGSRRNGETVTVTVGDLPDGFYVADDGPGIPETDRDHVFDSGYSTTADGTGFGLSIVRDIAETHGWTVDIVGDDGARVEITGVERVDA